MNPFERAYTRELADLHEASARFAAAHPQSAGILGARARDPDVERLLAGFAFLCADLREDLRDAAELFARRLLESVGPHWLRTLPPATIVELSPNLRVLRSLQPIPRGKELRSPPSEHGADVARFTTAADVELAPIEVVGVTVDHLRAGRERLRLRLRASDAGIASVPALRRLRLFIHHRDPEIAANLRMWLTRYCVAISSGTKQGGRIVAPYSDPQRQVLPWPKATPPVIRALVERLAYPDLLGFVDLEDLHQLELAGPEITIDFEIAAGGELPPLPALPSRLPPETIRLHCALALNLFATTGEPFSQLPGDRPWPVRADGAAPEETEIFDVAEVFIDGRSARRRLCGVLPDASPAEDTAATYAIDRSLDCDGNHTCHLSIDRFADATASPAVISTRLLCTHRQLPPELGVGSLGHGPLHLLLSRATNITAITPPRRPTLSSGEAWRLVDHLSLGGRSLRHAEELRSYLLLHAPTRAPNEPPALLDPRIIDAILAVARRRHYVVDHGSPLPVIDTEVTVDRGRLATIAQAELLGELLDPLFAEDPGFAAASRLTIILQPAGERLSWPLRTPTSRST